MRITITHDPVHGHAWDSQTLSLRPDGAFEFAGLRPDSYSVFASVKGYRLPANPIGTVEVKMEHDVADFTMSLEPKN
jgi:hypothetical protein